jgi:NADH:ubiquinone oxidoreductase subunit F (NADH-binding)
MRPNAEAPDVASAYHLRGVPLQGRACAGTACFLARALRPARWHEAASATPRVHCLGKCYVSPAVLEGSERPSLAVSAPRAVVLERLVEGGARTLSAYARRGGYQALAKALETTPDSVLAEVARAGLRGRGGAGFPTERKLRAVAAEPGPVKYVVMNADEGDPGAYLDRMLLEDDPHAALEGLALAAYAVGATRGYVYLRREYPEALPILEAAVSEARGAGILGPRMHGAGPPFDVEIVVGLGSYVCGEETALLSSLEGRRPFVRSRPPYPAQEGLFGKPTLVQNVETLVNLPWIVRHGGAAYASMGLGGSRGTKVVSLNSLFHRPGLYEVELGTPVRTIVEQLGGGLVTGAIQGLMIGGPLAGVLPPRLFDVPLAFEELHAVGASVGHGGVMAFDQGTSIRQLVHHVFCFGAYESCGRCTPCRLGAQRIADMTASDEAGASGAASWDARTFEDITAALARASLCGHGTGLGEFAGSILRHYREELLACWR